MLELFVHTAFKSHSGVYLPWKIDCDALSDQDLDCIVRVVAPITRYNVAVGIPRGGLRLAHAFNNYSPHAGRPRGRATLLVDDVLTTGRSLTAMRAQLHPMRCTGFVLFARSTPPPWVRALFILNEQYRP